MARTQSKSETNPASIEKYLKGIRYPADKEDLVRHAEDSDAPPHVIDALEAMPHRDYASAADVTRGMSESEESEE